MHLGRPAAGPAGLRHALRPNANIAAGLAVGAFFTAEFACLFEGVARTTAAHAVLLLYTAPFFTAAGAHLFVPGEKLTLVQLGAWFAPLRAWPYPPGAGQG